VRPVRRLLALGACAAVLSACATAGSGPAPVAARPPPGPVAEATPRERVDRALTLLAIGDATRARPELEAALARDPSDATARILIDQIDKDPVALLGARSYAYRVRPGESLSQIAGRLLGDPRLFYALARYNGVAAPQSVVAGQVLRIPGTRRKAQAASRPAAPAQASAPVHPRDPARASRLRGAALQHLNGGKVDRAVALLREARDLDPDNALIRRDLDRAVRIQGSVRARS
jgi:hypothetical protein